MSDFAGILGRTGSPSRKFTLWTQLLVLLIWVGVAGCSQLGDYQVPLEEPPEIWRVASDFQPNHLGEIVVSPHITRIGETLIKVPLIPPVGAELTAPFSFPMVEGKSVVVTLPAGTRLIPMQFSMRVTDGFGSTVLDANGSNDPNEWCVLDQPEGQVCLFFEDGGYVRVIPTKILGALVAEPETTRGVQVVRPELRAVQLPLKVDMEYRLAGVFESGADVDIVYVQNQRTYLVGRDSIRFTTALQFLEMFGRRVQLTLHEDGKAVVIREMDADL